MLESGYAKFKTQRALDYYKELSKLSVGDLRSEWEKVTGELRGREDFNGGKAGDSVQERAVS